ncbi:MAG: flavodoxin family protein [Desulfarculaceae bacterium]|nr:flavodoxin family protein [Desulfarculaceae bacterium]
MEPQVIGVSGSPVKNSNTDRLVKEVLEQSGLSYEFVKLSKVNIRPCIACLNCAEDNVCKVNDDFPPLAEKLKKARALVMGSYPPYGSVDGFSKAFLERLFSMRHRENLNKGKLAVIVTTGVGRGLPGLEEASLQAATVLQMEGMEVLGQIKAEGNVTCMVCGFGTECRISALPHIFEPGAEMTPDKFLNAEDQPEVWNRAKELGRIIGERAGEE